MTAAEGFRVECRAAKQYPPIRATVFARREGGDAVVGILMMEADEWAAFAVICKAQGIPVSSVQESPANGGDDRPSRGGVG